MELKVETWPIERLVEYARNPRKNDEQVERMKAAIKEFGFRIPVVAKSDGTLVDGHLRLKAARALGLTEVPVALADELTDTQVKAFRLLANQSANWAEWDYDLLKLEMEELEAENFDLDLIGFDAEELEAVGTAAIEADAEKEDEVPDAPEKPVSVLGDLWLLGEHRLLCGDSTKAESFENVMGGAKADMVFTDPPYGVAIGDKNAALNEVQKAGRCTTNIAGDTMSEGELYEMLKAAFTNTREACDHSASYYVTSPQGGSLGLMMMMMKDAGLEVRHVLMWEKNTATFSLGRLDYDYQHEPIFYTWTKAHHNYRKGENRTTIWRYDKPRKCDLHPTMKPVALVKNAMLDGTKEGDCVLDPFGGSGTTLIAAEETGRKARLIELDPHYCDVIVKRWEEFSGKTAKHESGKTFAELAEERK